ncbi:LOW QUALITY PROTEIN: hypothetical protein U9M48_013746 [Paspalum notatum var. saurae]|uniref:Protein FAR1-RELATED SEQUENCE n=1 Tax=Paspalum notatum var. saurae TaxID=547442 RepID=A0AAQ3T030_PASNO
MAEQEKGMPQVGLRFKNLDEAWQFWVAYGGRTGFDVRKRYANESKYDGEVTSCRYVCSNEGHRRKGHTDHVPKYFRAETRTDRKARMTLMLDRGAGNYEVTDVVLEHNHLLHLPETQLQAFEIETADDSRIRPKAAHELASHQVGAPLNLSYTCRDRKNYLQSKRQRELAFGQAGSMLKNFHDKIVENPSFQYALQLDCEEHITNIFWADAKMILDYAHFGDLHLARLLAQTKNIGHLDLDKPQFVVLHFCLMKQWTHLHAAHNEKQPRTIFTDQDAAMAKAILKVFTESYHGLCTFHIMQNAVKHLSPVKRKKKDKGTENDEDECEENDEGTKEDECEEKDEESHILSDFSACMYGYENKETFQEAFDSMRSKVCKQTWLDSIYKVKEKWAKCYMRDVYTLGVRSTQLSESFNNALKNHLKSDFDIVRFFKHFERTVEEKRAKELESEFEARKKNTKKTNEHTHVGARK